MSPRVRKWFLVLLVLLSGLYLAYLYLLEKYAPSRTLYYRLDVTFEVDGVPVTGSAIHKLVVRRVIPVLGVKQADWTASGEAVVVDLPNRSAVFVPLIIPKKDRSYFDGQGGFRFLVSNACELKKKRGDRDWADYVRMVGETSGTCQIPDEFVPMMVRFRDEADPASVERVFLNNLEDTLGEGVRFVGASLTITDGPMTNQIRKRLTWLSEVSGPRLAHRSNKKASHFAKVLEHSYFRRIYK
jgi:hypothetical protein